VQNGDGLTGDTGYKDLKVILVCWICGANGTDVLLEQLEYKEIKVTLVLLDLMVQMDDSLGATGTRK
jgi:hypothetical protein